MKCSIQPEKTENFLLRSDENNTQNYRNEAPWLIADFPQVFLGRGEDRWGVVVVRFNVGGMGVNLGCSTWV